MSNTRQRMNLRVNISPPRANNTRVVVESPTRSGPVSPLSSCLSSDDTNSDDQPGHEATSMVLAGCPRCLIYVMLSEDDPRCPNCKSTVLLNFVHDTNNNYYNNNNNNANYYYYNNNNINANYYNNNGFSRKARKN